MFSWQYWWRFKSPGASLFRVDTMWHRQITCTFMTCIPALHTSALSLFLFHAIDKMICEQYIPQCQHYTIHPPCLEHGAQHVHCRLPSKIKHSMGYCHQPWDHSSYSTPYTFRWIINYINIRNCTTLQTEIPSLIPPVFYPFHGIRKGP
jgi:hypothetical protein